MTTSGTLNATVLDVITLIEKATRKCGVPPSILDSETLMEAKSELYMMLSSLVNDGIPLWTMDKQVYGVHKYQQTLHFSSGTVDVINMLYRTNVLPAGGVPSSSSGGVAAEAFDQNLSTACTQTSVDGYIMYDFLSPVVITTVGLLPNSTGNLNPAFEFSSDAVNWSTAIPPSSVAASFTAGTWYWQDVLDLSFYNSARYFRVRETSGGTLDMTEVVFGTKPYELPMSRQNRDDYQMLPNKQFTGRPLQYWFDRQITPQAWIWPSSDFEFNTIVAWRRREIQDVGTYTNTLEVPNRWLDDIVTELASRICLLPSMKVDPQRIALLQGLADNTKMRAWTEERDNSPVLISPNIRGYT